MSRICLLCQTQYEYCPYCAEDAHKPKWMFLFHDENCHMIFDTLQRNYQKFDSDEVTIKKLKECNLDVLKTATKTVNEQVKMILSKERVNKPVKKEEIKEQKSIDKK